MLHIPIRQCRGEDRLVGTVKRARGSTAACFESTVAEAPRAQPTTTTTLCVVRPLLLLPNLTPLEVFGGTYVFRPDGVIFLARVAKPGGEVFTIYAAVCPRFVFFCFCKKARTGSN